MKEKALILSIVAAVGAPAVFSQSTGAPPSQNQSPSRLTTMTQRSLLRHCLYTADLARNHTHELLNSAAQGRPNPDQIQQHFREVQGAVARMFEDHRGLLYHLTDEQWKSAKDPITALEKIRISVQVQLDGMGLERQMPNPDPKVFARYGTKLKVLLEDWRKQHRKMGASIGIKL